MHYFMVPATKEILFSTGIIFIHFLNSKWGFSKGSIFSMRFSDFVKFKDISRTGKMNLLYSRFSRTPGNPDYL